MGRHHLSPRTHPSLRSTTANRRRAGCRGRFCSSRDKSIAASHPSTRTLGPGSTHLENRTVPCSRGLRLTVRQLCRISSSSGRSMLSPSDAGHGDGTLWAWAQSPHVQRHLPGDAVGVRRGRGRRVSRPSALVGRGPATTSLVQRRGCAPLALPGDPLGQLRLVSRSSQRTAL